MCFSVKDLCKSVNCGRGTCVVTPTAPFSECKCKHPYKPPNCTKGLFFLSEFNDGLQRIVLRSSSSRDDALWHRRLCTGHHAFPRLCPQLLSAGPIPVRTAALAWKVSNVSNVLVVLDLVESSAKLVNTIQFSLCPEEKEKHTSSIYQLTSKNIWLFSR